MHIVLAMQRNDSFCNDLLDCTNSDSESRGSFLDEAGSILSIIHGGFIIFQRWNLMFDNQNCVKFENVRSILWQKIRLFFNWLPKLNCCHVLARFRSFVCNSEIYIYIYACDAT